MGLNRRQLPISLSLLYLLFESVAAEVLLFEFQVVGFGLNGFESAVTGLFGFWV